MTILRRIRQALRAAPILGAAVLLAHCIHASEFDWPQWRGPQRNGVSTEKDWSHAWPKDGPKTLWKVDVGVGYAAVAVRGDRVFTIGNLKNEDVVWCLNAATGAVVWKHAYASELDPHNHAGGPGATPTVDGDSVYTLSKHGLVHCLDAATGRVKWSRNTVAEFGAKEPTWAFSASPLVAGDALLLNVFGSGLALRTSDGDPLWKGAGLSGYASPVLFKAATGPAALFFGRESLAAVSVSDGKVLWDSPWKTAWGENTPDPLALGDAVFLSSGHGLGAKLMKIGGEKPEMVWENKAFGNHIASSVEKDGFLYGFSGLVHRAPKAEKPNYLGCIDVKTGEAKWTQKDLLGQLMLAGDRLLMMTTEGELIVAEANPEKYVELARAKVLDSVPGEAGKPAKKCWTVPTLSNKRIYCRNAAGTLICLDAR